MMAEWDTDHIRHIWTSMTHSISLMSEKMCLRVSEFVPRTPYWESMSSELFSSRQRDEWDLAFPSGREIRGSRDVSDVCRKWCSVSVISRNSPNSPGMGHVLVLTDRNSFWSCLLILFELHDIGSKPSPFSAVDDYTCLFVCFFLETLPILPQALRVMGGGVVVGVEKQQKCYISACLRSWECTYIFFCETRSH